MPLRISRCSFIFFSFITTLLLRFYTSWRSHRFIRRLNTGDFNQPNNKDSKLIKAETNAAMMERMDILLEHRASLIDCREHSMFSLLSSRSSCPSSRSSRNRFSMPALQPFMAYSTPRAFR